MGQSRRKAHGQGCGSRTCTHAVSNRFNSGKWLIKYAPPSVSSASAKAKSHGNVEPEAIPELSSDGSDGHGSDTGRCVQQKGVRRGQEEIGTRLAWPEVRSDAKYGQTSRVPPARAQCARPSHPPHAPHLLSRIFLLKLSRNIIFGWELSALRRYSVSGSDLLTTPGRRLRDARVGNSRL